MGLSGVLAVCVPIVRLRVSQSVTASMAVGLVRWQLCMSTLRWLVGDLVHPP